MGNKKAKLERKEVKLAVQENLGGLVSNRLAGIEEQVADFQDTVEEMKEIMAMFAKDIGSLIAHCQAMNVKVKDFEQDKNVLLNANAALSERIRELENG